MISFFRKIRQKLLQQNKVTRYLAYAIGEIILVVIGILIALQVNNWNQERLGNIEAEKIEKSIHAEFKQNQVLLQAARTHLQTAFDSNLALLDLVGNDAEMLDKYILDSLFYFSLEAQDYHPSKNTIDVAIQSGKMKNEELQNIILKWGTELDLFVTYKNSQGNWQNDHILPYLIDRISLIETEHFGNNSWARKSKLSADYAEIFQDLRYENLLDNHIWLLNTLLIQLKEIEVTQGRIVELTR